ncbi:MAG: hypothetical protein ACK4L4_04070 [Gemmobacter sp.]
MRLFRLPSADRLPRPAALLGLAFGVALPLVLAGMVHAVMSGGLSDTRAQPEPAYIVY